MSNTDKAILKPLSKPGLTSPASIRHHPQEKGEQKK